MKSKGFSSIIAKDIDIHSGESLWRKYRDINAFVINASCMLPPSGISKDECDIFVSTWKETTVSKARRKEERKSHKEKSK